MDRIPDTGTTKDIRNLVKSVFIPALPKDSRARQIAEDAHDPASADSFLRGKAEFDRAAAALKLLPDSAEGARIRFRLAGQETLTQAGMVVALWQKAAEDRTTIFPVPARSAPPSWSCRSMASTSTHCGRTTSSVRR
ncbi:MAG: hypothetical protein HZT41_14000 [Dechloromonas sp.]|nr:MAG: hypothetical protein HZT41_14000 [Dechloromonas sp.]